MLPSGLNSVAFAFGILFKECCLALSHKDAFIFFLSLYGLNLSRLVQCLPCGACVETQWKQWARTEVPTGGCRVGRHLG